MRPTRILAVARADWATESKGRQGLVLPLIMAFLLLPAATVPSPLERAADRLSDPRFRTRGDVPAEVVSLPDHHPEGQLRLTFARDEGGRLGVAGGWIPASVRAVLDGPEPAVVVEYTERGFVFPGRTMLFAMVSSSTLTGAVASSIGGERSRRTLVVLLSAAVSRAEIVAGKAFAWTAWGIGASGLAALAAIVQGRVEPGFWLLPMFLVPFATVSVGLWLVRSAADVVAGTATLLRALPAGLAISAIVAFLLGEWHPMLGAVVPLGGALIAAGDTWPGLLPSVVASVSTATLALAALAGTVRDLEESHEREPPERRWAVGLLALAAGVFCWWLPVAAPLLWGPAGNALLTLPVEQGALAGGVCLLAASAILLARGVVRSTALPTPPPRWPWLAALAVGAVLPFVPSRPFVPFEGAELLTERLASGAAPAHLGLGLLVLVADELCFRGWVTRGAGPWLAVAVWVVVKTPLDPLSGLIGGGLLTALAVASRSTGPALLARVVAWFVAMAVG